MTDHSPERRRTPRISLNHTQELQIGRRLRAMVVDISANGVLLWTDEQLPAGSEGRLNVLLDGQPVEAQLQIRREVPATTGPGCFVGAALTSMQPAHRQVLEQFLRRAGGDPTMD